MRGNSMTSHGKILSGAAALTFLISGGQAVAQTLRSGTANTVEAISVTAARPVASAMDVIEEKYGVLIDYVDPQYAAPEDLVGISLRPGHVTVGPKIRTLSVQYTQVAEKPKGIPYLSCTAATVGCAPVEAWPDGGMTRLIQHVLDEFAAQGGQVFAVRKIEMPYGPRWEVYPQEVRDRSGVLEDQPDLLGASIYVPSRIRELRGQPGETHAERSIIAQEQERAAIGDLWSIYGQLEATWGSRFRVAGEPVNAPSAATDVLSGENISAWRALARWTGQWQVLRFFYAPDDGMYYSNIVRPPDRPWPRPPTPAAVPTRVLPPRPRPPQYWLARAWTPDGIREIQGGLVKAGFLHTAPTTQWDAAATAALRQFQASVGFRPTGVFEYMTAWKLAPFLPTYRPVEPAKPAMDPALRYWLDSTLPGRKEVQEALTKAGFYSGPATGSWDEKTSAALRAFQTANGLQANGLLDDPTADRLAPLLPKPN